MFGEGEASAAAEGEFVHVLGRSRDRRRSKYRHAGGKNRGDPTLSQSRACAPAYCSASKSIRSAAPRPPRSITPITWPEPQMSRRPSPCGFGPELHRGRSLEARLSGSSPAATIDAAR